MVDPSFYFKQSPTGVLADLMQKVKAEVGTTLIDLGIGSTSIEVHPSFIEALPNIPRELNYLDARGYPPLLEALVEFFKDHDRPFIKSENLFINDPGLSEGLMWFFEYVAQFYPGQTVVVSSPFYHHYKSFADRAGVGLVILVCKQENDYQLPDDDEIERVLSGANAAAWLFNFPCNPSGAVVTRERLQAIVSLAMKYNLLLFDDGAYNDMLYGGGFAPSLLDFPEIHKQVIFGSSFSKTFNLQAARLGFLACFNKQLNDFFIFNARSRNSANVLQYAAVPLVHNWRQIVGDSMTIMTARKEAAIASLAPLREFGVSFVEPKGAFYILLDLHLNAIKLLSRILQSVRHNGRTVNFTPYFIVSPSMARIALSRNVDQIGKGIDVLRVALEEVKGDKKLFESMRC